MQKIEITNFLHLIWEMEAVPYQREEHYIIKSSTPQETYRRRTGEEKTAIHWGQRKLFLTLLQFMTRYVDLGDASSNIIPKIVYAGAAPGHNIALLSKLFPTVEFHLYDMNPFSDKLNGNPKIKIYKQLFLDVDAGKWTDIADVYLISDIRRDIVGKSTLEAEKVIIGDMQMQMKWYEIMRPKYAQLKFHLPYADLGLDPTTEYLDGTVYNQAWRGSSSTECRLVPEWGRKKIWNNAEYENQNFYINSVLREGTKFINPIDGTNNPIDGIELRNDFDSTTEICILMDYLERFSPDYAKDYVKAVDLSRILSKAITLNIASLGGDLKLSDLRLDPLILKPKSAIFTEDSDITTN